MKVSLLHVVGQLAETGHIEVCLGLTAASQRLISSLVQVSGSPLGSASAGNISPPYMAQMATPVTKPANAITGHERSALWLAQKLNACFFT
jgi:hypothetical protein